MIEIKLFMDTNEKYENFKNSIENFDFEGTLAIITKDKISYEYFADEGNLNLYKSEIDENGSYNTIDKFWVGALPETLEEFFPKLLRLFL